MTERAVARVLNQNFFLFESDMYRDDEVAALVFRKRPGQDLTMELTANHAAVFQEGATLKGPIVAKRYLEARFQEQYGTPFPNGEVDKAIDQIVGVLTEIFPTKNKVAPRAAAATPKTTTTRKAPTKGKRKTKKATRK